MDDIIHASKHVMQNASAIFIQIPIFWHCQEMRKDFKSGPRGNARKTVGNLLTPLWLKFHV